MGNVRISTRLAVKDVDFMAVQMSRPIGKDEDRESYDAELLCEFLAGEMAKAGGTGTVEVSDGVLVADWDMPAPCPVEDAPQVSYFSHLVQAGIMKDPSMLIARTVYGGGGKGWQST